MIDPQHLREYVVAPTLHFLQAAYPAMWSGAAENLMVGTALVESDLTFLAQHGGGPAQGLWQMERATHDDITQRYLRKPKKATLHALIGRLRTGVHDDAFLEVRGNLYYACAMARIKYWMSPRALPAAGNIIELGRTWKRDYNTRRGRGDAAEFERRYRKYAA